MEKSFNFFSSKFWIETFWQLWENFEEIQIQTVAEYQTKIGHQKHTAVQSTETNDGKSKLHILLSKEVRQNLILNSL